MRSLISSTTIHPAQLKCCAGFVLSDKASYFIKACTSVLNAWREASRE
jgi:hypothetical protein